LSVRTDSAKKRKKLRGCAWSVKTPSDVPSLPKLPKRSVLPSSKKSASAARLKSLSASAVSNRMNMNAKSASDSKTRLARSVLQMMMLAVPRSPMRSASIKRRCKQRKTPAVPSSRKRSRSEWSASAEKRKRIESVSTRRRLPAEQPFRSRKLSDCPPFKLRRALAWRDFVRKRKLA